MCVHAEPAEACASAELALRRQPAMRGWVMMRFMPGGLVSQEAVRTVGPRDPAESPVLETRTVVIEPPRSWEALNLRELWGYRELLYFLTWRDVKVRYKQTALGAAWAVLQPLLTMVVFSVIFGALIRVPSDGVPYPVFAYVALLPWTFFASALTRASTSLVSDATLLTKVYFPRLLLPVSAVLSMTLDFAVSSLILLAMMGWYGIVPGVGLLTLPLFVLLAFVTALACGFWLSALNVRYRDIAHVIPFLVQIWFFITPVAYPSSIIPERWRALYGLNPMVGVVEGFRWALLDTAAAPRATVGVSVAVVIILFVGGVFCFRRMEHAFADVV
jgi:lipopolysaccharide transport system permease protein